MLGRRPCVFCLLLVCLGVVAKSQQECLDQISSGRRCCTPSAFTKLSFKLRLNSVAEGCDSPSYLDQGVRLEVRRPGHNWEPVRFYTATLESRDNSLITGLPGGTRVADENNSHFPVLITQVTEPFTVSEYFCGTEYYTAGTEYRWLQRYNSSAIEGQETWSLGDVSITYDEGGLHCSALLTKYHFREGNGSNLDGSIWTPLACEQQGSSQPGTLYFSRILEVDGFSQRGVLLTPTWWNSNCSSRTFAGCELSEECRTSTIGDEVCSVGTGMQCQCQFPQVPGRDNACFDTSLGFERAMYNVSEHETAELCVIGVLSGVLLDDIQLLVTTQQGTANATDFTSLTTTVTLTNTMRRSCVSIAITDDSISENMENFTVSLSLTGPQHSAALLSRSTTTISIFDNDVVKLIMESDTLYEGQKVDTLRLSSLIDAWVDISGTALGDVDFYTRRVRKTSGDLLRVTALVDDVWEGCEDFQLFVTAGGQNFVRTVFIRDLNELHVGFNDSYYAVRENDSSVTVCVTIQQGHMDENAVLSLEVSTVQIPGSAQEVLDYRGISTVITFNSSVSVNCLTLVVVDDNSLEQNETLMMSLSFVHDTYNVNFTQKSVTVKIMNDDVLKIGFVSPVYSASEGLANVTVCIEVKEGSLSITPNLSLSTYNHTAGPGSVMDSRSTIFFSMDEHVMCRDIMFNDDMKYEETENLTLSLTLTGELHNEVEVSPDTATISVIDDDYLYIGFEQSAYTASERDASISVCIEVKDGLLGAPISVIMAVESLGAQANSDFQDVENRVLTIEPPFETPLCVAAVSIINDMAFEDSETLNVLLTAMDVFSRVIVTQPTATIIITDDDMVTVGFDQRDYTVREDGRQLEICVTVRDGMQLGTNLTVHLESETGTAEENKDYINLSRDLTLSPTTPEQCVSIDIIDDTAFEENEMIAMSVSLAEVQERVQISPQSANVFITDNDELTVGFKRNYEAVPEGGMFNVCVEVPPGKLGKDLTLQLSTHSGTASDGIDFDGEQKLLSLNSTTSNACVQISTMNDTLYEDKEFFTVSLSVIGENRRAVHLPQSNPTLFIENDDDVFVDFMSSYYSTNESAGSVDVCVWVVTGQLGTNITLELNTLRETATAVDDFVEVKTTLILSPSNLEGCVTVNIVDDEAVEWSETLTLTLSQFGVSDTALNVSKKPVKINITDDDVAVIALETVTHDQTDDFRLVDICAVTNNTLERTFNLSVVADIVMEFENGTTHSSTVIRHLELEPSVTHACLSFKITKNQELSFFVVSPVAVEILNPNGTILSEPSFDEILTLLKDDNVNVVEVIELLDDVVNTLINNEQTASYKFSNTLIDVVSRVLDVTNESPEVSEKEGIMTDSKPAPGTSLLETLDKFALQSFNSSHGTISSNNTKIGVLNMNDVEKDFITGISGPEDEMIEIQAAVLMKYNFSVTVGSYYFRNVSGLLPGSIDNISNSELVSSVLSSALWCEDHPCDPIDNTSELVRISLHHRPMTDSEEPRCVFYNLKTNRWSEDGCTVSNESNSTLTICSCNHLTHFAVMLSPKNSVNKQDAYNMRLIGYVGTSISLTCLLIIVFIFTTFKSLWSMRNYIHVNLSISLFVAQLLFVVGVDKTQNQIACQTIAVVLHYAFLVTFMWMLMEGVVLYVALVRVFVTKPHRYVIGFTVVSYGAPLVYMALAVPLGFLLSRGPHYGGEICWLRYDTHFIWALISPVILIILANIGFFFMAIYIIWKQQTRRNLSTSQIQKAKHWLKVSVSLLVVMGIAWIIGVMTFHEALLFVSYIFTVVVAFQGAIMFIMFVILSKQVKLALKKWFIRSVIMKSDYLSEHFSDFTRSTQTGYSQSHSSVSTKNSTVAQGIQLGAFLAPPAKPEVLGELQKEYEATVLPSPSPAPSTPYASSRNSPLPHLQSHLEEDVTDGDEGPPNTFTVIYVTNDKDSGRGSPDTDTICTPPPHHLPTLNSSDMSVTN
ncbi:Adhesion G protein-coupled receptor L3 [Geodia barretti]|uniref:Adhesion G protein-coupled receptor L3 n=1 Tax=Geodia barretti TaxID=519541 RepID=A0AA35RG15_GEOBA|nr:Adhesion G protein-coupled receptor L3 [Geodia barretti]